MVLNLKELIVLKEKLKNTYAYQNSEKLKGKNTIKRSENDLVFDLVEDFEKYIELKTKNGAKLNERIVINICKEDIPELDPSKVEIINIPDI